MIIHENLNSGCSVSLDQATQLLGVSRSGYIEWKKRLDNGPILSKRDMDVRSEIQNIAIEFPGYGYRRLTAELRYRGYPVNHKRVLRLMREDNLLCIKKKFKPVTTDSNHNLRKYPNLIKDLEIIRLNQVWASDITYIRLLKEYVYLAVILDLFSRRCIGWELSRNIDTQLTLIALEKALKDRWDENLREDLIHHSDQGVQYASDQYIEILKDHGIQISMSRKGNPYDNAFVESFIGTLKCEEVYLNEYETFLDALDNIPTFIEEVYNKKRLHSSLGYRSPIAFEKEVNLNTLA
jgi:transposase InsO family protein